MFFQFTLSRYFQFIIKNIIIFSGIITCMNGRKLVHENLDLVNASQRVLVDVTKKLMNQTYIFINPMLFVYVLISALKDFIYVGG